MFLKTFTKRIVIGRVSHRFFCKTIIPALQNLASRTHYKESVLFEVALFQFQIKTTNITMKYQHITVWYIRIPGTLFTEEEAAKTTESTPAPQDSLGNGRSNYTF